MILTLTAKFCFFFLELYLLLGVLVVFFES